VIPPAPQAGEINGMMAKLRRPDLLAVQNMLSIVIATQNSARPFAGTLAMLVPGAMRGVVREVIVADGGSTDATIEIADAAGCHVLASTAPLGSRLAAAAAVARARWLMFLRPGTILEPSWLDEIAPFIDEAGADGGAATAVFRSTANRAGGYPGFATALSFLGFASFLRPHPDQGLVIGAGRYKELGGHRAGAADPESDLLARIGRRRMAILRSAARR
jgi:glycosyltransferase involved in cell wall biosynthesis